MWIDEASLVVNILNRSYLELAQQLDYHQAAPIGFLWIEKLATQVFGASEYSLRLFPLVAGIVSLFALYQLGKWSVSTIALPIAIALFAFLKYPIYYATEVKQYSSDVMVALLLCLLLLPLREQMLRQGRVWLIGLLGAIALSVSHPAVFVLAGIELANLILTTAEKRKSIIINRLPAYLIWIISFVALYFLTIANAMRNQTLQNAWGGEYPSSIFDLIWLLDSLGRFFYRPLGFLGRADAVAILVFVIGCVVVFRRSKTTFLILLAPTIVTLVATYLHKYPFRGRLVLYLAPFFILILAEGAAFLLSKFNQKQKYLAIVGAVATCFLILPPTLEAGRFLVQPDLRQEIRPVIEYMKAHQQSGDGLYIGALGTANQFDYYTRDEQPKPSYVVGYKSFFNPNEFSAQGWQAYARESGQLQDTKRVWFLFSGLKDANEAVVKPNLDQLGQEIDYFKQTGAFVYLYQLK